FTSPNASHIYPSPRLFPFLPTPRPHTPLPPPSPYTTLFRSSSRSAERRGSRRPGGPHCRVPPAAREAGPARAAGGTRQCGPPGLDRKSTRLNSSHVAISYAVFCLKKKKKTHNTDQQRSND